MVGEIGKILLWMMQNLVNCLVQHKRCDIQSKEFALCEKFLRNNVGWQSTARLTEFTC